MTKKLTTECGTEVLWERWWWCKLSFLLFLRPCLFGLCPTVSSVVDCGRQRDTCLVTFGVDPGRRLGQLTGLLAVVSQLISWLVGIEAIVPVE
ncbi:O-methyltransferase aunD [Trichinella spiralis]|uniref:O-methyltransferase aunD n=1 Tax=Trichinella spiralis TaxID=6334 RepID=A0ABR3K2A5_TRISP